MSKKTRFLSMVLALVMIVPMFSAFAVVGEAAVVPYGDAEVGDLLYRVNFNGDDVWEPAKISGWGNLTASVTNGGASATFSPSTSDKSSAYKNAWGGSLSGLPVAGNSYTVIFTATGVYSEGMHIGISLNGGGYTLFTPGRDRYALGYWNTYQGKQAFGGYTYTSGEPGKGVSRTYAIEIAADANGDATKYELYVKDGASWTKFYTMTGFSDFNWGTDDTLSFWAVKYLAGSSGGNGVDDYNQKRDNNASLSNVCIYKGNGFLNTSQISYNSLSDGDKIADVNFNDYYSVKYPTFMNGKSGGTVTVSADGKSVTLAPDKSGGIIWGGILDGNCPGAGNDVTYTVTYRAAFDNSYNMFLSYYPDAYSGIALKPTQYTVNGMHSTSTSDEPSGNNWKNKADTGANVRDFAVVINPSTSEQTLYVKNRNGLYVEVWGTDEFLNAFDRDNLYIAFMAYSGTTGTSVTFSNVSVYKGNVVVTAGSQENAIGMTAYQAASDGQLLKTVTFNESGWNPGFFDANNNGANTAIDQSGKRIQFTLTGTSYNRAIWGARPLSALPLSSTYSNGNSGANTTYTYAFDLKFGNESVGIGLMLDGNYHLLIGADGNTYHYNWNTDLEGSSCSSWSTAGGISTTTGTQFSFALEMDYDAKTYKLYVKNPTTKAYVLADTFTVDAWTETPYTNLRFNVRKLTGKTLGASPYIYISNLNIYKGIGLASSGALTSFDDLEDGAFVKEIDFGAADFEGTTPGGSYGSGYATTNGTTVTVKAQGDGSPKIIWGADSVIRNQVALPLTSGVKYTFYYHLELDSNQYFVFFPDGLHGISVRNNSSAYTSKLFRYGTGYGETEYWDTKTDYGSDLKDFAVELDYDNKALKLYGKNINGTYNLIKSATLDEAAQTVDEVLQDENWDSSDLQVKFFVGFGNNKKAVVSNFQIYKGNVVNVLNPAAIGMNTFKGVSDGNLLKSVKFNDDIASTAFRNEDNDDALVTVNSNTSLTMKVLNQGNKRAFWDGVFNYNLPLYGDADYTFTYSLAFNDANVAFAFYPDGTNGLLIGGDGSVKWNSWNSKKDESDVKWTDYIDDSISDEHTFAVKMDYIARSYTLYLKMDDDSFRKIATVSYSGYWSERETMICCLYVRLVDDKIAPTDSTSVVVKNLKIYRGLTYAANQNKLAVYDNYQAGECIETIDFNTFNGTVSDSTSYNDVTATIVNGGAGVKFTLAANGGDNNYYGRAMYTGDLKNQIWLADGTTYTFIYTVTFSDENMAVGFYPDDSNGIVIRGDGQIYWKNWSTNKVNFGTKWKNKTDVSGLTQTFAVVMNYTDGSYWIYVQNRNGSFTGVTNTTREDAWTSADTMYGYFFAFHDDYKNADPETAYEVTVSNFGIYKGDDAVSKFTLQMEKGAATRTVAGTTGLRFTADFGTSQIDQLVQLYGENNVKIGMLITPTSYVEAVGTFTKEALEEAYGSYIVDYDDNPTKYPLGSKDGYPYIRVRVPVSKFNSDALVIVTDSCYKLKFSITGVKEANYSRYFSSIGFVECFNNDGSVAQIIYTPYTAEDNSRSVAFVSAVALQDTSANYTPAQKSVLSGFADKYTYSWMQYNVEMYDSKNGWEDGRTPAQAMTTIRNYAPDIVSLNEINGTSTSSSSSWSKYETTLTSNGYTKIQGDTTQGNWNDLFYKTSRFEKSGSGTVRYYVYRNNDFNSNAEYGIGADLSYDSKRTFTWATLTDKDTGKKILAIATHLTYGTTDSEGANYEEYQKLRMFEIEALAYWIENSSNKNNYDYIIVGGDMNAASTGTGGTEVMQHFTDNGFSWTLKNAAILGDTAGSLIGEGHITRKQWIFDHIMTIGNVNTVYFTCVDNVYNGIYPSDHLPVYAKFVLGNN